MCAGPAEVRAFRFVSEQVTYFFKSLDDDNNQYISFREFMDFCDVVAFAYRRLRNQARSRHSASLHFTRLHCIHDANAPLVTVSAHVPITTREQAWVERTRGGATMAAQTR